MTLPFLGVEKSFTNRRWEARPYDERMAMALSQRFTLPDLIARSLSARGIDLESAQSFLEPRIRDLMPEPSLFKDMDRAASRFADAIRNKENIAVFGDYDVDGGTSSALLIKFARANGINLKLYIPDRIKEGYGPNNAAMRQLSNEGVKLVICVDCGTTAYKPLAAANDIGLDVIVIDHHTAEPELPLAYAIVNPNRLDDEMSEKYGTLAAVGVTYIFIVAVNRILREAGWYKLENTNPQNSTSFPRKRESSGERPRAKESCVADVAKMDSNVCWNFVEPNLLNWLDLVALGTICDVVKLNGLNRAFVTQGLKIMQQRNNAGIAALANVAGLKGVMDTYAAGFILGPRVNAGGRVAKSDQGAKLLSTDDPAEAQIIAANLHQYNIERREIEAQVLIEAEAMMLGETSAIAFVFSENWHPGVIGIVASRLKEKFHRPAMVIAIDKDIGKGSGRSIGNIDLGTAIIAARQAGLLINGGGHKMAAGLTVERSKIPALKEFLSDRIGKQLEAEPLKPTLTVDGLLSASSLQIDFIEKLSALAPFGTGNPEPRFALSDCRIVKADVVGEKHVSVIAMNGGTRLRAIAFRAMDSDLGTALLSLKPQQTCHLAGHIRCNEWQGEKRAQLLIDDAAMA